jgi:hypothetical protein
MSDLLPKADESIDELMQSVGHIETLAWWPTFFVKVVSGILIVMFTWLQFRSYNITQLIEKAEPETFLRVIVVGFFFSWVLGPNFDIRIQKAAYTNDPDRGAITRTGLALLVIFSLSATLMLWATLNEKMFFVTLTGFIILNFIGYGFIYLRVSSIVRLSEIRLREDKSIFRLAKLNFVKKFMFGPWQVYRFIFMAVSMTLLDTLCFITPWRSVVSGMINQLLPISQNTISSLLPDLGLMCFLIASEGWIWTERLKVSVALETIDSLSHDFKLSLLSNS